MSKYNLPRNIQFIFEDDAFTPVLSDKTLIVSDQLLTTKNQQIRHEQVNQYLGQELNSLHYDAVNHFNVNQFVAIVGCLVGGGNLEIRLPNFYKELFRDVSDSSKKEDQVKFALPIHSNTSQLLLRFVRKVIDGQAKIKTNRKSSNNSQSEQFKINQFKIEQNHLIEKIERCALGHAKRPIVITADRGRGKSTALAKASARLCYINNKKIVVTAPRKDNLNIFFKEFDQALDKLSKSDMVQDSKSRTKAIQRAKQQIEFIAIDKLLKTDLDHHFLIVDEAGSFPVQILGKVIKKFNRIAFASTVSGYEGNGRGFEIKFIPLLAKTFPQYRTEKLRTPYRWQLNDLLEDCCNKAFLLAQPSNTSSIKTNIKSPSSTSRFQFISKERLLSDEHLLSSTFTLLTEAHYQTRPSDLERMLSVQNVKVFVGLNQSEEVVSAGLIVVEGTIPNSDCIKISQAQLRIKGQLLPQSLISTKGIIPAGELTYWRVMRIAVSPALQNRSIGSNMIKSILQQAKKQNIDILGTSFALSNSLFNFWNSLDFQCCRIALRSDSSTGLVPAEFLMALTNAGKSCSDKAVKQFNQSFIYSCSASYRDLDTCLLVEIMSKQVARQLVLTEVEQKSITAINNGIESEIYNYTNQARSFEMVEWQISKLVQSFFSKGSDKCNQLENLDFVFAKTFQKHTWIELVENFDLKGQNDAKKRLQECIQQIYNATYQPTTLS